MTTPSTLTAMLSIDQIDQLPPRRVPRDRGLRRPGRLRRAARAGRRDRRRVPADRAAHGVHHRRAGAHEQPRVPRLRRAASGASSRRRRSGPTASCAQDKALSINKIGHAMHDLDPVFEAFSYTAELAEVAADIGLADPLALQSMYIFKQPHIGGEVGCHQDATFLYTDPITVTGFWFAIEDATLDNGCLWAQPGGHRGPLRRVFQRAEDAGDDDGTTRSSSSTTRRCRRRPTSSCRSSRRPARWSCCTACCRTGATSTAHRRAATPTACTASPPPPTTRRGTGCSVRPTCRCAGSTRCRCQAQPGVGPAGRGREEVAVGAPGVAGRRRRGRCRAAPAG